VGETPVTLADGTSKPISKLQIGDAVKGRGGINHVISLQSHKTREAIYSFNGGKAFVTGGHPFWTQDGWKAIDPSLTPKEKHGVQTKKLEVGDTLYLDSGEKLVVKTIDTEADGQEREVFNPSMDGDETYHANGLLVHNKNSNPCN
jgi:hypothetical protein